MTSNTLSILPEFEVFQFLIVLDLFIAFNLIPKKTPEVLFTSYMAFVLPTLYTRGSGNLTSWRVAAENAVGKPFVRSLDRAPLVEQ